MAYFQGQTVSFRETSLQNGEDQPHAHFHQKPTLQNDNVLNTSISLTFSPCDFDSKKTKGIL